MQDHWTGYLKALGEMKAPKTTMPAVAPYQTSSDEKGKTGFMDLLVQNPQIQARYDAMSGSWEGIQASEGAVSNSVFKTESMPLKQTPNKK